LCVPLAESPFLFPTLRAALFPLRFISTAGEKRRPFVGVSRWLQARKEGNFTKFKEFMLEWVLQADQPSIVSTIVRGLENIEKAKCELFFI
jgi:hypothetical protein